MISDDDIDVAMQRTQVIRDNLFFIICLKTSLGMT